MATDNALHAEVRHAEGMTFLGRGASNHWVVMDASEAAGGCGAGSSPMELVLMALGGCTSMDIVSILEKRKEQFSGFRVGLTGERSAESPRRFTRITVEYMLTSDTVRTESVVHAVELSVEKYCSVGATLAPGVQLVYRYRILRSGGEESGDIAVP